MRTRAADEQRGGEVVEVKTSAAARQTRLARPVAPLSAVR